MREATYFSGISISRDSHKSAYIQTRGFISASRERESKDEALSPKGWHTVASSLDVLMAEAPLILYVLNSTDDPPVLVPRFKFDARSRTISGMRKISFATLHG